MPRHQNWTESLYASLANEEDARVCKAIDEAACREVPGNFFRIFISNTLTKIGDRVASPKTTLAWLLQSLGAPAITVGLVVPIREAGSLLPQLFIAAWVRQMAVRKWVWVLGAVLQGVAIAAIAGVPLLLDGAAAGWAIVGLVSLFALARGLSSIASKDVMGKTIPKTRRGRLNGLMSAASGAVAVGAGLLLVLRGQNPAADGSSAATTWLLLAAAVLWWLAAAVYSRVVEFPGATEGGGNALSHALGKLSLLREDRAFRHFVITRSLAIGSGLSAPFVISLAHQSLGGGALWLGAFIAIDGLAALLSAPLWGRWADASSRSVLGVAMLATALILGLAVVGNVAGGGWLPAGIFYPVLFFLLCIAHSGVRLGRKTYLVDLAEGNKRTDYVALSNSVIGVILLLAGAVTGALSLLGIPLALAVFALLALLGAGMSRRLPEVSG